MTCRKKAPYDLRGKSVVVTGASLGIGRELAIRMAGEGARVTLAARSREALEETAAACRRAGGEALVVPTDVGDRAQCEALIGAAVGAYGGIDVLVNNAGLGIWARFEDIEDLDVFERLMRVNFFGAVYCTHRALPHLKARDGLVVAVSSLTGKTGVPMRSAYGASKHAMQGFFDSLRVELRRTGVGVLVVSPGFVDTGIRERNVGADGRPLGSSPRDESRDTISVETCVDVILDAIHRRRREVVMTLRAKVGMWAKLFAPAVVDAIAARAIGDPGR